MVPCEIRQRLGSQFRRRKPVPLSSRLLSSARRPLTCGSQASVMMRMRVSGKAGTVMPGRRWSPRDCNGGGPWRPARLVTAHDGADTQPSQQLLHRLGGRKSSFREAPIFIYSPLVGLRPSRSGVSSTLQFPNRGSEISAPFAAGLVMLSCILSPACCPQSVTDPQSDRLRRPDCIRGGVDCSGSVCCRTCFKNIGPRSAARQELNWEQLQLRRVEALSFICRVTASSAASVPQLARDQGRKAHSSRSGLRESIGAPCHFEGDRKRNARILRSFIGTGLLLPDGAPPNMPRR